MNTNTCPIGGECGGDGWIRVPANDGPNSEPLHYEPCDCNPYAIGQPGVPMPELRVPERWYLNRAHWAGTIAMTLPEPF